MIKTAIRTPEGAKTIIEDNIQILYHIPKKYKYLNQMIEPVKHDVLRILQYIKNVDPIIWKQKYVWYLDNGALTYKVRKKSTTATSNRHFNYLCCMGLLNKIKQTKENMINVNMEFMIETNSKMPMNVFSVYRYTDKELQRIEERSKKMSENKITSGNISKDKLIAADLKELAEEVYFSNSKKSFQKKEIELKKVLDFIEKQCTTVGFTTKNEICSNLNISKDKLDSLFKIFKKQISDKYNYKAASKEQKQLFNITTKKWIITRR